MPTFSRGKAQTGHVKLSRQGTHPRSLSKTILKEQAMHPIQIELVQSSFARVEPIADTAASLFYARLFELEPGLRLMFTGDINEQGKKLMTTLKVVVNGLTRLEALVPAVQALGRRHAGYGVADEHYDVV